MPPAGRTLTCSIALGACYVLAQLALMAWAGTRAPYVSYAFSIVSPLLALAACCRCAYVSAAGAARTGWALFAVAMLFWSCLLYTSPSPRDATLSRMPSSA